jgi:hypothetical protein
MSKRMKRIALSTLISLAVVAGVYTSVLGASLHRGATYGSVHLTAGVSHLRNSTISLNDYSDLNGPVQYHDCSDGNSAFDPND